MMNRTRIGIIAIVLLGIAGALWITQFHAGIQAACLRVGLVAAAVWLAYPQVSKLPPWAFIVVVGTAVLVAWQRKLAIIAVPLLLLYMILRPRSKPVSSRPESARHSSNR